MHRTCAPRQFSPDFGVHDRPGVWGAQKNTAPASVTDNHLVAQAWLPSMLHRFLSEVSLT